MSLENPKPIDIAPQPGYFTKGSLVEKLPEKGIYPISLLANSDNALVFHTDVQQTSSSSNTTGDFVLKLLKKLESHDGRYSKMCNTRENRTSSLVDILNSQTIRGNKLYYGITEIIFLDESKKIIDTEEVVDGSRISANQPPAFVQISQINATPKNEALKKEEHAIIMRYIPQDRLGESFLNSSDTKLHIKYANLVVAMIANQHNTVKANPLLDPKTHTWNGKVKWGDPRQLRQKLAHNLDYLQIMRKGITDELDPYNDYRGIISKLGHIMPELFEGGEYGQFSDFFQNRLENMCIDIRNGDYKSPNIGILTSDTNDNEEFAVAFDAMYMPIYTHIDALSDFAYPVVDLQARTGNILLADEMIENYLQCTGQNDDETARKVIKFYLVEKALVGGLVAYLFDHNSELAFSYLDVADIRLDDLKETLSQFKTTRF